MEKAMMAILCSDGQLKINDIVKECVSQKWIPLLTYRYKDESEIYLPIFSIQDTAKDFIKRNLPKEWLKACIYLSVDDIEKINSLKWRVEHFSFPRKIVQNPNIILGFEIFEFQEEPNFLCSKF